MDTVITYKKIFQDNYKYEQIFLSKLWARHLEEGCCHREWGHHHADAFFQESQSAESKGEESE